MTGAGTSASPGAAAAGRGRGRPARYTRDDLLELVVGVFNERGYEAASMEDLARASGLTKSTFYHHVSSKEELLGMAVDRALDALSVVFDDEPTGHRSARPVDRLTEALRRTTEVLLAELPYVTLLLRVRGNTDVERAALARRRAFDERLAVLVRSAADAGEIRADIEPRLVSRLLFGMVNSLTEWYRPTSRIPRTQITRAVVELAMTGLGMTGLGTDGVGADGKHSGHGLTQEPSSAGSASDERRNAGASTSRISTFNV